MDRPKTLLQVICSEQICNTSQFMQQSILETKHRRRSHDCCLWKDVARRFLCARFGSEKLRRRVFVDIVGRYMDEAIDIVFSHGLRYTLRTLHMDIF